METTMLGFDRYLDALVDDFLLLPHPRAPR
jgi:hypothetical protein